MKFIKENSYDIVRLIINQIGIMIFSLVLYTSVSTFDDSISKPLSILVSVFSTIFYLALVYNVTWEYGSKDKIRIDAGKITCSKYKGLCLGLCANSVNFVLGFLCILFDGLYIAIGAEWLNTAFFIFNIITRFVLSTYLGMVQGIFSSLPDTSITFLYESVAFMLFPILSVLVAHAGYMLGYKDKRLFSLPKKKS